MLFWAVLPQASRWTACFKECMVAITEAQELELDLAGGQASISDLVGAEEAEAMADKT